MEIKCSNCGAMHTNLSTFTCEFCKTINTPDQKIVNQLQEIRREETHSLLKRKGAIEEKVKKTFNFIPVTQQIGAAHAYPRYIDLIAVAKITTLYSIFLLAMWHWYQQWYLNGSHASSHTFFEAVWRETLGDDTWGSVAIIIITTLTGGLLFLGFKNTLRTPWTKQVLNGLIGLTLAWAIMDGIALIVYLLEGEFDAMTYHLFVDQLVVHRYAGDMLMVLYLLFAICFLMITHRAYKKEKVKRQEAAGISVAVDLTLIPKLNPGLGLAEIQRLGAWDTCTYEQGLIILLTANIPFEMACKALMDEGLEIRVDTIKERLRNPFVVNLKT